MVRPLDESQGPSHVRDHGPWLMYEVALSMDFTCLIVFSCDEYQRPMIWLLGKQLEDALTIPIQDNLHPHWEEV